MKKIVVILILLILQTTAAFGIDVNDDTTLFGTKKAEYGPKPNSLTLTTFMGGYFYGLHQDFPSMGSQFYNMWRYGIRAGYSFTENIELDAHLAYTPTVNLSNDLNVYDYGVNGYYQWVVSPYIVPYGTLGLGAATFIQPLTFKFTRFQMTYGAGVKFFVFKNMALSPEIAGLQTIDPFHVALLTTLNLTYYFGPSSSKPRDRDGDGIPDKTDRCPDQPETVNGYKDEDGCPENPNDLDGDGIINEKDKCPKDPETFNGFQDEDGCPENPNDWDGDGITNEKDKCPKEPETVNGFQDEDGCPEDPNDLDGDGIINEKDKCPREPETLNNHEDEDGCPDQLPNDADGDGVPDNRDRCPDQKEIYNGYRDDDGCPDDELDEFSGTVEGIVFEVNQAMIKKESYPKLNRAAEVLGKYPVLNFVIEGHTDSTGSKAYNMKLSERRAQSVYEYLRYRGISPERMSVEAYGPTKPIASNNTVEGRNKNRRIEFRILNLNEARKQAEEAKKRAGKK